jgi:hypothetical protein
MGAEMNCPSCGIANADAALFCRVCSASTARPFFSPPYIAAAGLLFLAMIPFRARLMSFFWPLDLVNLAFHEGGHVVFGLLGLGSRFIMVAGGTLMQLLMPAAAAVHFLKRGEKASACACLFWVGQNFLGIGHYAADARAQQLDLIAGGVHDWTYLLEVTGLLIHDVGVGASFQILGCLIMAAAAVAGARAYSRGGATAGGRTPP